MPLIDGFLLSDDLCWFFPDGFLLIPDTLASSNFARELEPWPPRLPDGLFDNWEFCLLMYDDINQLIFFYFN